MINFKSIPADVRTPGQYIEFDASRAVSGLPAIQNRVLIVGQRLAAGAVAASIVTPIIEPGEAIAAFGRGSMLARMVSAYKKADRFSPVYALALDDVGGGVAASGTITVTGPATATGLIALMVAGVRIEVVVVAGDIATAIAANINTAIGALLDLPVTSAVAAAVVTVTARNKGTTGNQIDLRHSHEAGEALPSGVGLAIVAMANGAGDPDIDAVWAVIGDTAYRTLVLGFSESATLTKVKTELDSRWGPLRMLETVAYAARSGTQGALAAFGAALNSELISVFGIGKSPSWAPEAAASYAAACGYHSAIDPARPLHTLQLVGMVAPKLADQFTRAQRDALLRDGIATFVSDQAGTCTIERSITTYQTDALGIDSIAYLDLETVLTLAYLRASVRVRIATKFPRHKLANDGTAYGVGQAIVTPRVLRAELIALAREWEEAGLAEDLDQFVGDLIVERAAGDPNRVNALIPPNIVNQFRSFAAAIQFRL